jgi:hypothetical protein
MMKLPGKRHSVLVPYGLLVRDAMRRNKRPLGRLSVKLHPRYFDHHPQRTGFEIPVYHIVADQTTNNRP